MDVDDIDRFGHCVVCHKNMLYHRIVDGKEIQMFKPDHGHTEFLLDNGSRMRVCICNSCKENVDLSKPSIQEMVMKTVVRGWQLEVNSLVADESRPDWDIERGEKYMEDYSKLNIDCHSDGISNHVVDERKKKINEMIELDKEVSIGADF